MYCLIDITNFKSIKKATAKLPSFGAIVGRNAAGKTNLIQSVRFVRDLACGKTCSEAQKSISLIPNELFNFNEGNMEFGINISIKLKDESQYLLCVKIGLINGSVKPALLLVNEETLYKLNDDNSKEIVYLRDKNGLKDKNNVAIPVGVDNDKLALAVYKIPDTDQVKDAFVKTVIPDMRVITNTESMAIGSAEPEYENLASIILSLHHNHPQNYNDFQTIVKKIMPHFSSIIEIPSKGEVVAQSPEKESYLIVLEEKNLKQKLSMQSVSSGDLKTLLLIATTLNMDDYSTLIVEEIENGIHPKRISDLIEHLDTISKVKKMQILFTTHSPIVINKLSAHEILLTKRESDAGTQFILLDDSDQITRVKKYLQEGGSLTDFLYTSNY